MRHKRYQALFASTESSKVAVRVCASVWQRANGTSCISRVWMCVDVCGCVWMCVWMCVDVFVWCTPYRSDEQRANGDVHGRFQSQQAKAIR